MNTLVPNMNEEIMEILESALVPNGSTPQESMKRRIGYDRNHLAPPTTKSWYGSLGKRWGGRGRKAPGRNWKYTSKNKNQYDEKN